MSTAVAMPLRPQQLPLTWLQRQVLELMQAGWLLREMIDGQFSDGMMRPCWYLEDPKGIERDVEHIPGTDMHVGRAVPGLRSRGLIRRGRTVAKIVEWELTE